MASPGAYPLELFCTRLREAGLLADARTLLKLQEVLFALGNDYADNPEDLWEIIAPVVARNAAEQRKVKELWAKFCEERMRVAGGGTTAGAQPRPGLVQRWKKLVFSYKLLIIGVPLIGALLCVALIHWVPIFIPARAIKSDKGEQVTIGDTVNLVLPGLEACPDCIIKWSSNFSGGVPKGNRFTYVAGKQESCTVIAEVHRSRLWKHTQRQFIHTTTVVCRQRPVNPRVFFEQLSGSNEVQFEFEPNEAGEFEPVWYFGDGDTSHQARVTHRYDSSAVYHASLVVRQPDHRYCEFHRELDIDLDRHDDYPVLPVLETAVPTFGAWRGVSLLWGIVLIVIATGFFLLWLLGRKATKAQAETLLQAEYQPRTGGPYNIPWPDQEHLIAWSGDIDRVAALMAGRVTGDRRNLDIKGSLRKTIELGGFPVPSFKQQGVQREWLFLIDESSVNGMQKKMIQWMIARLRSETVDVEAWWYHGSPLQCWNERSTGTLGIDALSGMFARARLVLVTDGTGLFHPLRQQLKPELESILKAWTARTLIPLRPVREWGSREKELSSFFGICPADSSGMLEYLQQEDMESKDYNPWKKKLLALYKDQFRWPDEADRIEELREELGETSLQYRWLCALLALEDTSFPFFIATGAAIKGDLLEWDDLVQMARSPLLKARLPKAETLGLGATDPCFLTGNAEAEKLLSAAQATLIERGHEGYAATVVKRDLALTRYMQAPANAGNIREVQRWKKSGMLKLELPDLSSPRRGTPQLALASSLLLLFTALLLAMVFVRSSQGIVTQEGADSIRDASSVLQFWRSHSDPEARWQKGDVEWNQLVTLYDSAKNAYEAHEFAQAQGLFESITKLENDNTVPGYLPDSVVFDPRYDSTAVGDMPPEIVRKRWIRLFALYGEAVTNYFNPALNEEGDTTGLHLARQKYQLMMQRAPRFFTLYYTGEPNLRTLLENTRPDPGKFQIEGVVKDADTDEPLPEARIYLSLGGQQNIANTTTDKLGKFRFNVSLPPLSQQTGDFDKIRITYKRIDRTYKDAEIPVTNGDRNVVVGLESSRSFFWVVLVSPANIPLPNIAVTINGIPKTTDRRGSVKVRIPKAKNGDVIVVKAGYDRTEQTVKYPGNGRKIVIAEDEVHQTHGSNIYSGAFVDEAGKAVNESIEVTVSGNRIATNNKGVFMLELPGFETGDPVTIEVRGYIVTPSSGKFPGPGRFTIRRDTSLTNHFPTNSSYSGTVTDDYGGPVAGSVVTVNNHYTTTTGPTGRFSIDQMPHLEPGDMLTIDIEKKGYTHVTVKAKFPGPGQFTQRKLNDTDILHDLENARKFFAAHQWKEAYDILIKYQDHPLFSAEDKYMLGVLMLQTPSSEDDHSQGISLIEMAAKLGNVKAQYEYASRLAAGDLVQEDDFEAAKWFKKASDQGDDAATLKLAEMYLEGSGVVKDIKQAMMLYQILAKEGNKDALEKLDELNDPTRQNNQGNH